MLRKTVLATAISAAFILTAASPVLAQNDGVAIKKIEPGKVETPEYQLTHNSMKGRSRNWYRVVTQYDTDALWTDELSFTYYVLVKNKDPKGPPRSLFRGKVTYVNVEKGRGHKSDVYLHPSTLARYGDVEAVAVLIEVGGRLVASESLPASNKRWWEQLSPVDGILLNRMQTPFAMINFDDYEAVKPTATQQ